MTKLNGAALAAVVLAHMASTGKGAHDPVTFGELARLGEREDLELDAGDRRALEVLDRVGSRAERAAARAEAAADRAEKTGTRSAPKKRAKKAPARR